MDGGISLAAIPSFLNVLVITSQKLYEIGAVTDEARRLLELTLHVDSRVDYARSLRKQKQHLLSADENADLNRSISDTDAALMEVRKLVEPARKEIMIGGVSMGTRLKYVLRDAEKVKTSLQRLALVKQSLETWIGVLLNRVGTSSGLVWQGGNNMLPNYEESEFLHWRRLHTDSAGTRGEHVSVSQTERQSEMGAILLPRGDGTASSPSADPQIAVVLPRTAELLRAVDPPRASDSLREADPLPADRLPRAADPLGTTSTARENQIVLEGRDRSWTWLEHHVGD